MTLFLTGISGSSGTAFGRTLVINDLTDFKKIRGNEILVTKYTSPDYAPVFTRIGGLITEQGGMTSHAAIVAREMGVPCIVGVEGATIFLKTGDEICIDANNGLVFKKNDTIYEQIGDTIGEVIEKIGKKGKWPFRLPESFYVSFTEDVSKMLLNPPKQLSEQILPSSVLWKLLSFVIMGMRHNMDNWPTERRKTITSRFFDLIKRSKGEDVFYKSHTNQNKTDMNLIRGLPNASPLVATKVVQEFKGILWLYAEIIYLAVHDFAFQIRGPYMRDGKKYLVHHLSNSDASLIWPEFNFGDTPKKVIIVSEFANLEISIDAFNNYVGENLDKPQKTWIFADGLLLDNCLTRKNIQEFKTLIEKCSASLKKMNNGNKMKKEIQAIYLPLKKWLNAEFKGVPTTYTIAPPSIFYDVTKEGIVIKNVSIAKIKKSAFYKQVPKHVKRLIIAEHNGNCVGVYIPKLHSRKKNLLLNPNYMNLGIEGRMNALASLHTLR